MGKAIVSLMLAAIAAPASANPVRLSVPPSFSHSLARGGDWVQTIPTYPAPGDVEDCDRPILSHQTRSLDGGYVYQQVCRWATSDDIIQVRLSDGRRREVTPGNSLAVIRNGPWRGYLVVSQHRYKRIPGGGTYDAYWVVRPDGKNMFQIPGTEDGDEAEMRAWLRSHGWVAN